MKKLLLVVGLFLAVALVAAGTSYAFGNKLPEEAYADVVENDNVYIVDVRTPEESKWVGHPGKNKLCVDVDFEGNCIAYEGSELEGKVINIPIMVMKKGVMIINKKFLKDIEDVFGDGEGVVLITMCRSGGRSKLAAGKLDLAGYEAVNMLTGFEGGRTPDRGYRLLNGWINTPHPDDPTTSLPYTK